jgi:hypothetical protein
MSVATLNENRDVLKNVEEAAALLSERAFEKSAALRYVKSWAMYGRRPRSRGI